MKRSEAIDPGHRLRQRPVTHPVDGDCKLVHAQIGVEAAADAEDGGRLADRQRSRQGTIEDEIQAGGPRCARCPWGHGHDRKLRDCVGSLTSRALSGNSDKQAARSAPTSRRLKYRPTEEKLRSEHLSAGTDREVRAARPRPGAEPLRAAYLELLKLSLCDLAGARTLSVSRSGQTRRRDTQVLCRELPDEELALRARGSDWPFSGLTMVGLKRLDDLQACVEAAVADRVEGDVIEAGTWRGGAAILARATLDSLGADERTVWVADSFRGLPPPDRQKFPQDRELDLSRVEFLAVSADEVMGHFARFGLDRGVELVEGFFAETLPGLRDRRWSVVRLDGDTYEATRAGLESLYPGLSAGGYLIVDDYRLIKECKAAVDDYRREHAISEPIEKVDWNGIRWRRQSEPESRSASPQGPARRASRRNVRSGGKPASRARIPTERELELERELSKLRKQLKSAAEQG